MMGKNLKQVIHETAKGFYEAGVMTEQTMQEFDALCLPTIINHTPSQIKRIRKRNKANKKDKNTQVD